MVGELMVDRWKWRRDAPANSQARRPHYFVTGPGGVVPVGAIGLATETNDS